MILNCFFDEVEETPDVIYIPNQISDIYALQDSFFEWVFDKEKSNATFVDIHGMTGCIYDINNFLYWLNSVILIDTDDKAYLCEAKANFWDYSNQKLFF